MVGHNDENKIHDTPVDHGTIVRENSVFIFSFHHIIIHYSDTHVMPFHNLTCAQVETDAFSCPTVQH